MAGPQKPAPPATAAEQRVRLAAPSLRGVVRLVAIVVACAAMLYLLWRVRTVVELAAISVFLALAMMPMVDALDRRLPAPRAVLILLIYLCLFVAIVVIGSVVIPSLVKEVSQLAGRAPKYASELRSNATFRHYDNRYHITSKLVRDARRLPQELGRLAGPLRQVTVSAFALIGQLLTVLAITFLLVLHGRDYVEIALSLASERRERYEKLVHDVDRAVSKYVTGNIAISVLATVATWIVLMILGVPYALALAIVVGFFDLIPLVGATLGAIVVAAATLTVSFPVATIVWIAFIVVWQRFEDYVVQPAVYGRALNVNPIVTILSVLAGAELLGILGALLAIPTAAAIQIVLADWWSERNRRRTAAAGGSTATSVRAD